jgi:hypothetical protein
MPSYAVLHQPDGRLLEILMLIDDVGAAEEIAQELRRRHFDVVVCRDDEARRRLGSELRQADWRAGATV